MPKPPIELTYCDKSKAILEVTVRLLEAMRYKLKAPYFEEVSYLDAGNENKYRLWVEMWFFGESETSLKAILPSLRTSYHLDDCRLFFESGILRGRIPALIGPAVDHTESGNPRKEYQETFKLDEHSHLTNADRLQTLLSRTRADTKPYRSISCKFCASIVRMGPNAKSVPDRYEEFEKPVVSGGRPESNRRKF